MASSKLLSRRCAERVRLACPDSCAVARTHTSDRGRPYCLQANTLSWYNGVMAPVPRYMCNDPGHPALFEVYGQDGLYHSTVPRVSDLIGSGHTVSDAALTLSPEVLAALSDPPVGWESGPRIQDMRRRIAAEWGPVFNQIENLAHFTGWLSLDLLRESGTMNHVLSSLACHASRPLLAAVNQYRSALTDETFGYWRTLYENLIKSRFVLQFSEEDLELASRFVYYTLDGYRRLNALIGEFDPLYANRKTEVDRYWEDAIDGVRVYRQEKAEGDYAWAYPLVRNKQGMPKLRPTLRDLIELVDKDSIFSKVYYRTSSAQEHGQLLWSPPVTSVVGVMSISYDPFSTGNIARMLELTLPVYREIVSNAGSSCKDPVHRCLMAILDLAFDEVETSVKVVKSRVPVSLGGM